MSFYTMIPILPFAALTACAAEGSVGLPEAASDGPYSGVMNAVVEGVYTLAAFFAAGVVIHFVQQRNLKSARARKAAAKKAKVFVEPAVLDEASAADTAALPVPKRSTTSLSERKEHETLMAAVREGQAAELPALLASARACAIARGLDDEALAGVMGQLLQTALRACASRRCFQEALRTYDEVQAEGVVDTYASTFSVLLYCAIETRKFSRCPVIIERLLETNTPPNGNDFVNIVRYYAQELDTDGLKRALAILHGNRYFPDIITRNRALSACTVNRALKLAEVLANDEIMGSKMDAIGYNTLMKCYLEAGQPSGCLKVYDEMRRQGEKATDVTFGVLLDACNDSMDADRAMEVFSELRASGIRMNVIHYTTYMKVLAKVGRLEAANELLDEMLSSKATRPDLVTYSTLVKANADRGNVASALRVLDKMQKHGINPDNVIFQMVLSGCLVQTMESRLVMHCFNRLVNYGMKTTTTTLSILLKALARSKDWNGAIDVLEHAQERFQLHPELRLFAQLAQACAGSGAGDKALECFFAMARAAAARGTAIDEQTSLRLLRHCSEGRESRAGAQLHAMLVASRGRVALEDVRALARRSGLSQR